MPSWPAYEVTNRPTMIFNTMRSSSLAEVVYDPAADERAFWDGVPFDGVVPTSKPEDL
jgi:carboxylesterase type B